MLVLLSRLSMPLSVSFPVEIHHCHGFPCPYHYLFPERSIIVLYEPVFSCCQNFFKFSKILTLLLMISSLEGNISMARLELILKHEGGDSFQEHDILAGSERSQPSLVAIAVGPELPLIISPVTKS